MFGRFCSSVAAYAFETGVRVAEDLGFTQLNLSLQLSRLGWATLLVSSVLASSYRLLPPATGAIPLVLSFGLVSAARAAAIVVPPSLNPGDTYRLIFVTNGTVNALSNDIAYYNSFVSDEVLVTPALAALGTTWKALASTSSVNVLINAGLDPTDTTTRFYNTQGKLIATGVPVNVNGLYGGIQYSHAAVITDSSGTDVNVPVWTGTGSDGVTSRALGGTGFSFWGYSGSADYDWTEFDINPKSTMQHLYAISGVLSVSVPEPSSLVLAGGAILMLGFAKLRRAGR